MRRLLFVPRSFPGVWLAVLVLAAALAGCGKKPAKPAAGPPSVVAAPVLVRDQPVLSEYIGQLRGSKEIEIRARVEGFLESVNFQEGNIVHQGDLLYTIDPRSYEANLAQARGELARAEAAWANAQGDVARYEPLIAHNAISRQQYDQAVATERADRAAVDAAKAVVEAAQLQLGYTRVTAPANGRIGKSEVQQGNLVGRGQNTLLTTISVVDPIDARFSVSEREHIEWDRLHPNAAEGRASISNRLEMILADGSRYAYHGSVVFADRNVDPATGTLLLEAAFPNPQLLLRPGQFVRIRVPWQVLSNAVLVLQRAVRELQGTYSVWVLTPDGKVEMRRVEPGPRVDSYWVIRTGLKPGDQVVIAGMQKLQAGAPVKASLTNMAENGSAPAEPAATGSSP